MGICLDLIIRNRGDLKDDLCRRIEASSIKRGASISNRVLNDMS